MTKPLSPAAQIVWDAAWQLSPINCKSHEDRRRQQIAAALRAAADQVVPQGPFLLTADEDRVRHLLFVIAAVRHELLSIAAELKSQP